MQNEASDRVRVLRTAAWTWAGYLTCLGLVDVLIYARRPFFPAGPLLWYYLANGAPVALFFLLAYSPQARTRAAMIMPWMIGLISLTPILFNYIFDVRLPEAPLSNIEGMVLRQLPVLFIGLILVAWHYSLVTMLAYSLVLNGFELGLGFWFGPFDPERMAAFFFVTVVRMVAFAVVGVFINLLVGRLRQQQAALRQANIELARYAGTLETLATSRERNRLARELHDTLAHTLSGLSVQLETVKAYWQVQPETAYELLLQALGTTRSGLDETRRSLKALRSTPLEDLGLCLALQELAQGAAERARADLRLRLPEQDLTLAPDVEQCVYRVAQEAVENVVRHAQAHTISLSLEAFDGAICLAVEDDGQGVDFSTVEQAGHYGVVGMRERAALAGGELHLISRPGQGTRVELRIKGSAHD